MQKKGKVDVYINVRQGKMREEEVVDLAKYILTTKNNDPEIDRKRFQTLINATERMCENHI